MSLEGAADPADSRAQVIVLGQTAEAAELRHLLAMQGVDCAKAQDAPCLIACDRDWIIDASHPYDEQAPSRWNGRDPTGRRRYLRIWRQGWSAEPADSWRVFESPGAMAAGLPSGARAMLTLGRERLAPFSARADCFFLVRIRRPGPVTLALRDHIVSQGAGPFEPDGEAALMRDHRITHLLTRNDGAIGAWPKIGAARALGLPVWMLARPPVLGERVANAAEAMLWLARQGALDLKGARGRAQMAGTAPRRELSAADANTESAMNAAPDFEEIKDTFELLDDWEERYGYVIELGKALPPFPEAARSAQTKVEGCVSQVWLLPRVEPGATPAQARLFFDGDSDALIVKGLIAVLRALLSGQTIEQIRSTDPIAALSDLGLASHLSPQRSNGLKAMVARIKGIADAAA